MLDYKIPDCLTKMTFLGAAQTALRSGMKARSGGLLVHMMPSGAVVFFSNNVRQVQTCREFL